MQESVGQFYFLEQQFPGLSVEQKKQFSKLPALYEEWNEKINLISRKDIENLVEKHILHSLAIAKVIRFDPGAQVMDIGTGGGFPGIPLAILYPEVTFYLVDSIEKKIKVVQDIADRLGLKNVIVIRGRAEEQNLKLDYVVSRATAPMADLVKWSRKQLLPGQMGSLPNGWVILKGGDLKEELQSFGRLPEIHKVKKIFPGEYFDTKVVIYLARQII